ncbi:MULTISPECIES: DUF4402 domain-containing protein [unclassified Sphingopyxis]|uniref:DUF4402 domain-containing protein n=1 Tax=unclassified Sphingopyxis TaxID=2614943 RepID=UPI002857827B|nr:MULTISPECIES: DUF4402 domain-containing protein [unclassified Sphingopyxis]MDR6833097.1 hypothetical protein [Sphingopyxis sp. BE122]MDR7228840.1 hypothetical protein [Sphingopyxis sp. BE259]
MGIRGTRNCQDAARALSTAAVAAGALLCGPVHAADTNVTVNAAVVRPNTLIKTDDLDFGTLVSGAAGGTVTINPVTNARTSGGGVTLVGTSAQRAVFQGTGGIFLITVSGSTSVTLARIGGGAPAMTATLVRAASTGGGGIALLGGTLLPSGVQTYYIGGTLTVPANQAPGDYSGTFTLTVNYL